MQAPISRKSFSRPWSGRIRVAGAAVVLAVLAFLFFRSQHRPSPPDRPAPAAEKASRSGYQNRALFRREAPGAGAPASPTIGGTVYDMEGSPLPGAAVAATTFMVAGNVPTTAGTTVSDERGRFELRLPEGSYHLTGDKEGYGPTLVIAHSGDRVSLVLPRSGAVEGHVYDERHRPVTRFAVDVITAAPDETAAPAPLWSKRFESPDGSYRVSRLPAWPVSIRVTALDYAPAFSSMLLVEPGKVQTLDLTVASGCTLTGTVEDGKGASVAYAFLDAEARMGAGMSSEVSMEAAKQTQTETDGRFRLEHVPTGPVLVRAYDGSHAVATASLQIDSCEKVAPVKLVMGQGGGVQGTVRDAEGKALSGARLTLSHRSVGFVNTVTDAEGRYHFDQIPPAMVRLEVQHGSRQTALMVGVKEGETVDQDVALFGKGAGEIHGRVTAAGRPLPGMQVMVAANHGAEAGISLYYPMTGEDGTYRVADLPDGGYMVSVASTTKSTGIQLKGGTSADVDIDVTPDPPQAPPPVPPNAVEHRQAQGQAPAEEPAAPPQE
jgi:Carboxypeptidase regulatory-like domain